MGAPRVLGKGVTGGLKGGGLLKVSGTVASIIDHLPRDLTHNDYPSDTAFDRVICLIGPSLRIHFDDAIWNECK